MYQNNYFVTRWIEDGTKRYFVPLNLNLFIEYDVKTSGTECILTIQEEFAQRNLYSDVVKYKNIIIFIPLHAHHFMYVDLETKEINYIDIPGREELKYQYGYFSKGIICNEFLYAIGYTFPGILKINLKTYEVEKIDQWYLDLNARVRTEHNALNYESYHLEGNLYAMVKNSSLLLIYHLQTNKYEIIQMAQGKNVRCDSICFDGEYFWIIDNYRKAVMKWSEEKNEIVKEICIENGNNNAVYSHSLNLSKNIYLASEKDAPVIVINKETGTMKKIWKNREEKEGFSIVSISNSNGDVLIADISDEGMYKMNLDKGNCVCVKWMKNEDKILEVIKSIPGVLLREGMVSLDSYIKNVYEENTGQNTRKL